MRKATICRGIGRFTLVLIRSEPRPSASAQSEGRLRGRVSRRHRSQQRNLASALQSTVGRRRPTHRMRLRQELERVVSDNVWNETSEGAYTLGQTPRLVAG